MTPECLAPPSIGVTFSRRATDEQRAEYRRALETRGGKVVELLPGDPEAATEGLDGVLLGGGGDVDPACYGQSRHPESKDIDEGRDELELRLTREALAAGMPVLGICRGAQVLGVALGGSLIQDIPTLVSNPREHSGQPHQVEIASGSRLAGILGCSRAEVNSFHHQANGRLGAWARAVAWSQDSVIEAIEGVESEFVIGVQWHPERMPCEPRQGRLFAAFVAAAAEHARHKVGQEK